MLDVHHFLTTLAMVLSTAAITTVLCQWWKQPVVLGYIVAGLIIGPHFPIPLVADHDIIHILSELGVILLMFYLGLEFNLKKLLKVGKTAGLIAVIEISIMGWWGYTVGHLMGWSSLVCIFLGGIIAISSTTIIAKAFEEQKIEGHLRDDVFGILIVEDLVAILLMAALTTLGASGGTSFREIALTACKLMGFLMGLFMIGLLVIPRFIRSVIRLKRPETTIVASIGICFSIALLAQGFGYSVALGAFIAGSLISESGKGEIVEHLVQPVRDVFAAIFFVAVGMMIDPMLVIQHWRIILILALSVVIGKVASVSLASFLNGKGVRPAIQAGMSMAQIGEFSFIIAALGLNMGVIPDFLYPVAVTVSVITTLGTPWLIKAALPIAGFIDRKLPHPLQTFVLLYGSWVEQLRAVKPQSSVIAKARSLIGFLFLDAVMLVAYVIGASFYIGQITTFIEKFTGLKEDIVVLVVVITMALIAIPFCLRLITLSLRLGSLLAEAAFPVGVKPENDFAAIPRRVLIIGLRLGIVLLTGLPVVIVTQPFLPPLYGAAVLIGISMVIVWGLWRNAKSLEDHMYYGAQQMVRLLNDQTHGETRVINPIESQAIQHSLPGIGEPGMILIGLDSVADGKTLAELNLRGITGAMVLAIQRHNSTIMIPKAQVTLTAGDLITLTGSHEAIDLAKKFLMQSNQARQNN